MLVQNKVLKQNNYRSLIIMNYNNNILITESIIYIYIIYIYRERERERERVCHVHSSLHMHASSIT